MAGLLMFGAATGHVYYPGVDQPHSLKRGSSIHYYATEYPGNVVGLIGSQNELANAEGAPEAAFSWSYSQPIE